MFNLRKFFGLTKKPIPIPMDTVKADESSQGNILRHHMHSNDMSHESTVIADVQNVVLKRQGEDVIAYFCNTQEVTVRERINPGDGQEIPRDVKMHGIKVPKELLQDTGIFNLKNVKLHSNGAINVIATSDTVLEPVNY